MLHILTLNIIFTLTRLLKTLKMQEQRELFCFALMSIVGTVMDENITGTKET